MIIDIFSNQILLKLIYYLFQFTQIKTLDAYPTNTQITNTQLNKLKPAAKNKIGAILSTKAEKL